MILINQLIKLDYDFIYFFFNYYIFYALFYPYLLIILFFIQQTTKIIFHKEILFNLNKNYTRFLIKNILNVNYLVKNGNNKIKNGLIIANHCSGFDNMYDSYVTNSVLLGDLKIKYYHGLYYFLQFLHKDILLFDKNKINRHECYNKLSNFKNKNNIQRMIFYPFYINL